jgi:hypothetical protein
MEDSQALEGDFTLRFLDHAIRQSESLTANLVTLADLISAFGTPLPEVDKYLNSVKDAVIFTSQITTLLNDSRTKVRGHPTLGFIRIPNFRAPPLPLNYPDPFPVTFRHPEATRPPSGSINPENPEKTAPAKRDSFDRPGDGELSPQEMIGDQWNGKDELFRMRMMTNDTSGSHQPDEFKRYTFEAPVSVLKPKPIPGDERKGVLGEHVGMLHGELPWLDVPSPALPRKRENSAPLDLQMELLAAKIAKVVSLKPRDVSFPEWPKSEPYRPPVSQETAATLLNSAVGSEKPNPPLPESKDDPESKTAGPEIQKRIVKKKRGSYQIFPVEVKEKAVKLCQMYSVRKTAQALNVSPKSVKRWMQHGIERVNNPTRVRKANVIERALANLPKMEAAAASHAEPKEAMEHLDPETTTKVDGKDLAGKQKPL